MEIINIIKIINKHDKVKNFNVCLYLQDYSILINNRTACIYLREWSIYFEDGVLEITAESRHADDNFCAYKEHYNYSGGIIYREIGDSKRIFLNSDINEFVADAIHYESYITDSLNDVEVDIDIWG